MPMLTKVGGTWRTTSPKVKVGGAWKTVDKGWVKVAGVWRQWHANWTAATTTVLNSLFDTNAGARVMTYTPTQYDLILVVVQFAGGGALQTTTLTDDRGGTYTLLQRADYSAHRLELWVRSPRPTAANVHTITATPVGGGVTGGGMAVVAVRGRATINAGTDAIRQSGSCSDISGASVNSITLGSAPLTTNPLVGAAAVIVSPATWVPPTGFADIFQGTYVTPNTSVQGIAVWSGFTSNPVVWGVGSSGAKCAVIAEINH